MAREMGRQKVEFYKWDRVHQKVGREKMEREKEKDDAQRILDQEKEKQRLERKKAEEARRASHGVHQDATEELVRKL